MDLQTRLVELLEAAEVSYFRDLLRWSRLTQLEELQELRFPFFHQAHLLQRAYPRLVILPMTLNYIGGDSRLNFKLAYIITHFLQASNRPVFSTTAAI